MPKKETGIFRLIHDLSFPKGQSVNDLIPPEEATVRYSSVDDTVKIINSLGCSAFLAKTDIQDALWLIPLKPEEYYLLGITWDNKFFYMTDACQWAAQHHVKFWPNSANPSNGLQIIS